MCISVDLPEPDGPITAVSFPLRDLEADAAERVDGRVTLAVATGQRRVRRRPAPVGALGYVRGWYCGGFHRFSLERWPPRSQRAILPP